MKGYLCSSFKETFIKIVVYSLFFGWIPLILTSNFVITLIEKYFYFGFLKGISDVGAGKTPLEEMLGGIVPSSQPLLAVLFLYVYVHILVLGMGFIYRLSIYMKRNFYCKHYEYSDVIRFSPAYLTYSKNMKRLTTLSDFIFEVLSGVIGAFVAYIFFIQQAYDEIGSLIYLIYNVFLLLWIKKFLEKAVSVPSE